MEELGSRAGLSFRHLGEIERGTVDLRLGTLIALADALGVPAWELLKRATPRS